MGHLHGDPKPSMLMQRAAAFHVLSLWNAWWKCAEMHIQTSTFTEAHRVNRKRERERGETGERVSRRESARKERKLSGLTHANLEADYFASAIVMMWQFICEQAEEERNEGWEEESKEGWGRWCLAGRRCWSALLRAVIGGCCQIIAFKKGLDTQKSERHLGN